MSAAQNPGRIALGHVLFRAIGLHTKAFHPSTAAKHLSSLDQKTFVTEHGHVASKTKEHRPPDNSFLGWLGKERASMMRLVFGLFALAAVSLLAEAPPAGTTPAQPAPSDPSVIFRSDVSLVRVDAQVVDLDNHPITGLRAEDFILREGGKQQEIRNFVSEKMPVDVILLLDVSRSMRPHVERVASAADRALGVLGDQDRVAILVFDRATRVRLPFRNSRREAERELHLVLDQENFRGGTDVKRGLLYAADYMARHARTDARRAIVILTDDQTERDRDDAGVLRALTRAD